MTRMDTSGNVLAKWGGRGTIEGLFGEVQGIATTKDRVLVSDTSNNRIQVFMKSGQFAAQFGSEGPGAGQFRGPRGITTDGNGNIYVADTMNSRVQRFRADGKYVGYFGSPEKERISLTVPYQVATGASGRLYVLDGLGPTIQMWTLDAQLRASWILSTKGVQTGAAIAFAAERDGRVTILDLGNHVIRKLDRDGRIILEQTLMLQEPSALAIDAHGDVYVSDIGRESIFRFAFVRE